MRFNLPLLDAAQAQKHVTINEALARADALGAGRVESRGAIVPPDLPADGETYIVGAGASGDWAGQDENLAIFLNGGWMFASPYSGQRVWIEAEGQWATYVAGAWAIGRIAGSGGGAASFARTVEIEHVLASGAVSTTLDIIPDKAVVLGVTGRVTTAIAGTTGWSLGVAADSTRYGSGYGVAQNAFAHGVTGQPQAYYGNTALEITAEGGSFSAGAIRLAVHLLEISPPGAV